MTTPTFSLAQRLRQLHRTTLRKFRQVLVRWRVIDHQYWWFWRAANGFLAAVILAGIASPVVGHILESTRYRLSDTAVTLVGRHDGTLTSQLKLDTAKSTYTLNKSAIHPDGTSAGGSKASAGAAGASNPKTYALELPTDLSKGVTYHDTNANLSFSLTPRFSTLAGKIEQGSVVFPMKGGSQAVYTLKNNGLKEDIVVPEVRSDTMQFEYTMTLPDSLVARLRPDGSIGVFSADPSLFGDIIYGTDADKANVALARRKAEKNTLVFVLPAPTIKVAKGAQVGYAKFDLSGTDLTVTASGLSTVRSAITIDPSVVITSTSDLQTAGNPDSNIDFSTSGQITRAALTGGSFGAWSTNSDTGSTPAAHYSNGAVAYNGYLYTAGGNGNPTNASYVPINGNGSLGAWVTTTSLPYSRYYPGMVAYNGVMYMYGGYNATSTLPTGDVMHAVINANGSLGPWITSVNSMGVASCRFGATQFNGYLYALGGTTGSPVTGSCGNFGATVVSTNVQFAPILANGDVGTWTTSANPFTTARMSPGTVAYNGYIYLLGGTVDGANNVKDIQWAPLLANGDVGTWKTTTTIWDPAGDYRFGNFAANGYVYIIGGTNGAARTYYAPINASGSIGLWRAGTALPVSDQIQVAMYYNGYIYNHAGNSGGPIATTYYAKIDQPATNAPFNSVGSPALGAARNYASAVAYNGFIYVLGGSSQPARGSTGSNTVTYAPINSDGTVGSWTVGSVFVSSRVHSDGAAVVYNGYMYYFGGSNTSTPFSTEAMYAPINANGSVGTWADTTNLPLGKFGMATWAYAGFVYTSGGYHSANDTACNATASNYCSDVQMAVINTNGTLGAWAAQSSMPVPSYGASAVVRGQYVWESGGDGSSNTTWVSSMASGTGALSWSTLTAPPLLRTSYITGFNNGFYYVMGNNSGRTASVATGNYVRVNDDGSFATDSGCGSKWCTMTSSMTSTTLGQRAGLIYQGVLYAFGGADTTTASTAVESTLLNNGGRGTVATWTTGTTNMNVTRHLHSVVAYNGYLYAIGGQSSASSSTASQTDLEYAAFGADGSVGSWTADTHAFTTARSFLGAVAYNGYLYIMGGMNGAAYYKDIQYAPIGPSGALSGAWASAGSSVSNGGQGPGLVAYNGYMYSLGGWDGSTDFDTVYYAVINADGTVGTWTSTSSFTNGRSNGKFLVANNTMYLVGGSGTADYNDVQYAPVNSNGTLSAWAATTSFVGIRENFGLIAMNGFLYIVGGETSVGGRYADVQYTSLNNSGTVNIWQNTSIVADSVDVAATAAYKGRLYIVGGNDASLNITTTQYTDVNSIARVGTYSKLVDLNAPENITGITYNEAFAGYAFTGTTPVPVGSGSVSFTSADPGGVLGSKIALGGFSSTTCTSSLNGQRYVKANALLDDTQSAAYPDALGTYSNLTDFTVSYVQGHPNSNIRLRAGKTLQGGYLSQLDTCKP
jgi:hypothetical protein